MTRFDRHVASITTPFEPLGVSVAPRGSTIRTRLPLPVLLFSEPDLHWPRTPKFFALHRPVADTRSARDMRQTDADRFRSNSGRCAAARIYLKARCVRQAYAFARSMRCRARKTMRFPASISAETV